METTIVYWGCIGIMEDTMEATTIIITAKSKKLLASAGCWIHDVFFGI